MKPPKPHVPTDINRRRLLRQGAALGIGILAAPAILSAGRSNWHGRDPFTLGVAAGAPAPDGFTLWTRLAPDPLSADPHTPGGMSGGNTGLRYEIAADPQLRRIVRRGDCLSESQFSHSVHLDVRGLAPGRSYWYRFISAGSASRIGRAMTLPAPGQTPQRLRLGFVSCANYEQGYFSAYRHLADEDPDLVIFLGDYLYEYIDRKSATVRRHSDGVEADSLPTYRNRYAQYRMDADLQRLHAEVPALMTWDDHEVENDYADKWSPRFIDPRQFLRRRAAAYQAYYEHMPVRALSRPRGASMRLYDEFRFGDLAQILLLDGRQYRSKPACYAPPNRGGAHAQTNVECPERLDPSRSLLGARQEQWVFERLQRSSSGWNVLAQDVMMAQWQRVLADGERAYWSDDWNGYPANRERLLRFIQAQRVANPVVIGGDIHSYWCNDLKADFNDPSSATVATEFVGTSVSAHPPPRETFARHLAENPHVRYFESQMRGYATLEMDAGNLHARFRAVSDAKDPLASVSTLKSFVVKNGRAGAVET